MKDIIIALLAISSILLLVVSNNYKNELDSGKQFEKGVIAGKKMCEMKGIDSVTLNGTIFHKFPIPIVQSITFKYDSIMIINFDSSEVK